ncbi:MAG TPA: DUF6786 family protein [Verrucomicrobiae bacterium]|jgi:hypothetical protein|nr:DUF6786 family protein [Verrucomicrobiae bacterium]
MKKLAKVLKRAGKPTVGHRCPDGTRLLVLPYGGRLLGLYSKQSDENFYWNHKALESVKTARIFYSSEQWHNSGGDRTWLGPEADLFFPNFPALDKYVQQRSLDPGRYRVVKTKDQFQLINSFRVRFSRLNQALKLKITKSFGPAPNPLRYEHGLDLSKVEYAGYTQYTSLKFVDKSEAEVAQVGLWNLVQMPHGGELMIPTFGRARPRPIFSTTGGIAPKDLIIRDGLIRYRMRQKGEHKISVRAVSVSGRVGYVYRTNKQLALIIRNFNVNPSGEYVDVPWNETDYLGFAVQACNVNSSLGAFSELEYHIPAIGYGTGRDHCHDETQVWAFRGSEKLIGKIQRVLLGP